MPSPFPGMDPYLEDPSAWSNVHHCLITAIADSLAPQLLPKYSHSLLRKTRGVFLGASLCREFRF